MEKEIKFTEDQRNKVRKDLSAMGYDEEKNERMTRNDTLGFSLGLIETYEKSVLSLEIKDPFQKWQKEASTELSKSVRGRR